MEGEELAAETTTAAEEDEKRILSRRRHRDNMIRYRRADRPATAIDEYVDLLIQKEHFQNESHVLREQLDGVHQLHQTLRVECKEEVSGRERDAVRATAASQDSGQSYIRINFVEDEAPFYYTPYTEDECAAVTRKTRRRIRQAQSQHFSTMKLFDWDVSIMLARDDQHHQLFIQYRFRKTVRNPARSIHELVDRQWEIYHSRELFQEMHPVPMNTQVLQHVDDDTSVVMWASPNPEKSSRYRHLSVYSRSHFYDSSERESRLLAIADVPLKKLPSATPFSDATTTLVTATGEQVQYEDRGFLYSQFSNRRQDINGCEIEVACGGRAPCLNEEHGRFLMVDIGNIILRLEQMLIPPRVLTTE
ncbi:hypothetical protein FI667_g7994, partial [Globisporangium splendens]